MPPKGTKNEGHRLRHPVRGVNANNFSVPAAKCGAKVVQVGEGCTTGGCGRPLVAEIGGPAAAFNNQCCEGLFHNSEPDGRATAEAGSPWEDQAGPHRHRQDF